MARYYSKSTGGFYDSNVHTGKGAMPADAVVITDELHAALLAGQAEGKQIAADERGRPVLIDPVPPAPTLEQIQRRLTQVVQNHLDARAQLMGYDSIFTAVTYADEPAVPSFQAEGQALRTWRSLVWARGYELLAEVLSGARAVPQPAELVALLPVYEAG